MTVTQAARTFQVDVATIRRWIVKGCPCVRRGSRGPGRGAVLDPEAMATWRGRASGPTGLSVDEVLQRIADTLWDTLDREHVDVRAGVDREAAAAVLIVVWEQACKNFAVPFKFDSQPASIRALVREL